MGNFALIGDFNDGIAIVKNIVFGDSKEIVEEVTGLTAIEYDDTTLVQFNYLWDGTTFSAPPPIEETQPEE